MRVCFTNLGCKLNQAELESLARRFRAAGHQVVASVEAADVHVINTCTVTHMAARSSRRAIRRGQRGQERLRTVVTGCHASAGPEGAAELAAADLVVPNERKNELVELVHQAFPELHPAAAPAEPELPIPYVPLEFGNTRALLKVEDGCNMRCAFCIIPFTRGPQRSRTLAECIAEARDLAAAGYREIVVTGVQISSYRDGDYRLYDLVRALLAEVDLPRLRLTSIAPWQFDRRLLELWADPRLCRHVHLSLQSGCSATLQRMRRPYSAESYARLLAEIRQAVPGVAITTDVIVGFPGETAAEFAASLAFVAEARFAKVHGFPYSPRPGTTAAELPDPVDPASQRARMAELLAVAAASEQAFWQQHLGHTETVLWERPRNGRWQGTTDNYVRVFTRSTENLHNRLLPTELVAMEPDGLTGWPQLGASSLPLLSPTTLTSRVRP